MTFNTAYYETHIRTQPDVEAVAEFLNKEDILRKFNDEEREEFIVQYVKDQGYEEVIEEPALDYGAAE